MEFTNACIHCNDPVDEKAAIEINDYNFACVNCFIKYYIYCKCCGVVIKQNEATTIASPDNEETEYCSDCIYDWTTRCNNCGKPIHDSLIIETAEHQNLCENCFRTQKGVQCKNCRTPTIKWGEVTVSDASLEQWCGHCIDEHTESCPTCRRRIKEDSDAICCGLRSKKRRESRRNSTMRL